MAVRVSAIILAAGSSRRAGAFKQLLPLGNKTIIEVTVDNYLESAVKEVVVVLGHRADEIARILGDHKVNIVTNDQYLQGMSTSLRVGLKAVDTDADGFLLALADQPLVDVRTINTIIKASAFYKKGITLPTYLGKRGNPVLFDIYYKAALLVATGDKGGRDVIRAHPEDVCEVAVDCPGVTADIDTATDYQRLLSKTSRKDEPC
ncbi:molybdenum cofactor cytidylyltransferase [Chloroflexota bacterium]